MCRGRASSARSTSERADRASVRGIRRERSVSGRDVDALSSVSGVSERRVRDAFGDCYDMSPTVYLRAAALHEVRRSLRSCPPRDAVTRAALDHGFWHLSRFAGQYRALFGESPSETVGRARALGEQAPHFDNR